MKANTLPWAVGLALVVAVPTGAQSMDFDSDCIAVVVDDNGTIITDDGTDITISFTAAAQQFYQTHGDDYDFLMFFPDFDHDNGSFRGNTP